MKWLTRAAVLAAAVMILGGCTQSSIAEDMPLTLSDEQMQARGMDDDDDEIIPREQNILIDAEPEGSMYDWDQVKDNLNDLITDTDRYTDSVRFEFSADEDDQSVVINWALNNVADDSEAYEYASYMVRDFNDAVAIQVAGIEMSSGDYFGGLWDTFSLDVNIAKEDGTVLLQKSYSAGDVIDLGNIEEETEAGPEIVEDDSPKKV